MKKILFALIALLLAFLTLTGCNGGDGNNKSTSSTPSNTSTPENDGKEEPDKPFENKTVLKTEHFEIDSKMLKYLYTYTLNVYYQYYGQYAQYYVTEDFLEASAKEMLIYCEVAQAEGRELSADELSEIADTVAQIESSLLENGYDSLADYYGEGVDAEAIVEALKLQFLSQAINSSKQDEIYNMLVEDKSGLEAYYDEHKELLFGTFVAVTVEDDAYYARLATAATKEEISMIANEYCTEKNMLLDEVMGEQAGYYPLLEEDESLSEFEEWFFNGEREKGDIFADDETKTVYIVALPAKKHTELLKNAGHILIIPDGNTEAYKSAAKAKAEAILDEYLAGEQTKEAFEAIAELNTEDGNVFYDNIYLGQMVEPFSDWVYDESRKTGDTGIVETEYGYHIMYFVGDGELKNYEYFALSELYEKTLLEWEDEIAALYPVTVNTDALVEVMIG